MKILFICKGNWFRSQMAAAIYNKLTGTADAVSAGTYAGAPDEPEGKMLSELFTAPYFFEAMEDHGLYIRNNTTKRLTPEMLAACDVAVAMAEDPYIPDFLRNEKRVIWWDVANKDVVDKNAGEDAYEKMERLVCMLIGGFKK